MSRSWLAGKVAIVTNISEPLGDVVAWRLADEGARVLLAGTDKEQVTEMEQVLQRNGATVAAVAADARTEYGAKRITHAALRRFGRIDAMVHNLTLRPQPRAKQADSGVDIDISGFFPMVFSAASVMALQAEGSIVLTAFVAAASDERLAQLAEVTTDVGFNVFVHAAAEKLYPHGINVNGVELRDVGATNGSDLVHLNFLNAHRKANRFQDAAHAARFLASGEAQGITGQVLLVGGGRPPEQERFTLSTDGRRAMEGVYRRLFDNAGAAIHPPAARAGLRS